LPVTSGFCDFFKALYGKDVFAGVLFPCYCFSAIFKLWRASNYQSKKMIGLIHDTLFIERTTFITMPISFDEIICKTSQMKTMVFKEILAFPTHLMLAQMIVC
jgi:hypothetical protein